MTVRLVKQKQQASLNEKPSSAPTVNQLIVTTQGWVEEFKARKAQAVLSANNFRKRS